MTMLNLVSVDKLFSQIGFEDKSELDKFTHLVTEALTDLIITRFEEHPPCRGTDTASLSMRMSYYPEQDDLMAFVVNAANQVAQKIGTEDPKNTIIKFGLTPTGNIGGPSWDVTLTARRQEPSKE